jgi:hypothetical protein
MCTCTHGADRHYLDYAGPGVAGGILTKCLEEGCDCILFLEVSVVVFRSIPSFQGLTTGFPESQI